MTPSSHYAVDPAAIDFSGYAENASATIRIEGLNKRTGEWLLIDTATASASSTTLDSGQTELYFWSIDDVDTSSTHDCIWGDPAWPACPLLSGTGQFRLVEVGSSLSSLTTFEWDGTVCVFDALVAGRDWVTAGSGCESSETPVLTLLRLY
ncbi:MAG: hypothetical protein JKY37_00990 [Nannocystaceae bacterium]|nr:hypothetical protein [Nannocystaceae bacterium]